MTDLFTTPAKHATIEDVRRVMYHYVGELAKAYGLPVDWDQWDAALDNWGKSDRPYAEYIRSKEDE